MTVPSDNYLKPPPQRPSLRFLSLYPGAFADHLRPRAPSCRPGPSFVHPAHRDAVCSSKPQATIYTATRRAGYLLLETFASK
jgi:hypothetical protein